jgi:hypothetical protein
MLTVMGLQVLGKSKFLTTFWAAEWFLTRVEILVLMEKTAVLEGLSTNRTLMGRHVFCVLTTVVFHY